MNDDRNSIYEADAQRLSSQVECLLQEGLVAPPVDFNDALLRRIRAESAGADGVVQDALPSAEPVSLKSLATALAVAIGAAAAALQSAAFVFGLLAARVLA